MVRYAENFLHMMHATPTKAYKVNPIHARAIDKFLILHADHEQNASTSTVRDHLVCGGTVEVLVRYASLGARRRTLSHASPLGSRRCGVRPTEVRTRL